MLDSVDSLPSIFEMSLRYREVWKVLPMSWSSGCNFLLSWDWGWDLGAQEESWHKKGHFKARGEWGQPHKTSIIMKSHKISHSYHAGELILRQKLLIEFYFFQTSGLLWIGEGTWSAPGLNARWKGCVWIRGSQTKGRKYAWAQAQGLKVPKLSQISLFWALLCSLSHLKHTARFRRGSLLKQCSPRILLRAWLQTPLGSEQAPLKLFRQVINTGA